MFSGSVAAINAALDGMTFTPDADFAGDATITILTDDLGNNPLLTNLTAQDTFKISVNDKPVVTVPGAQAVNEDTALVFSAANGNLVSIADADATNDVEVTLTVANGSSTLASIANLTFSVGDGTGDSTMTFTGAVADINAALNGMTYQPTADYAGADSLSISCTQGGESDAASVDIWISSDDPMVLTPGNQQILEDSTLVFSGADGNAISIMDLAAGSNVVEVSLSVNDGVLTLGGSNGLVFSVGDGTADANMTFQGSVDAINTALEGMGFTPNTDFNGKATVTINLDDLGNNGEGSLTAESSVAFDVMFVNDAPTGADKTVTTLEDTPYTFTAADFGFSDANDTPADSWISVMIFTLSDGTLTNNGVVLAAGDYVSVADINDGLLVYTPPANSNQNISTYYFSFKVQDDGGTANGGVDLDPLERTMFIDVTSVNDAPTGADNTVSMGQTGDYSFSAVDFGFADLLDLPANYFLDLTITSLPITGALFLNGNAVTVNQVILYADIPNLTYTATTWQSGVAFDSFKFKVRDDGGTANGGIDTSLDEYILTFWGAV